MKLSRLHLVRGAMFFTILLICGFQVYWVMQNYSREKQLLRKEVSVILRETGFSIQFGELTNLPGMKVGFEIDAEEDSESEPAFKTHISNTEVMRISPDSTHHSNTQIMIALRSSDTVQQQVTWQSKKQVTNKNETLDVARTIQLWPLDEHTLDSAYRAALKKGDFPENYVLRKVPEDSLNSKVNEGFSTNPIPAGFENFMFYKATFTGYAPFIWKRIWPQLLISLFIVCFSVFSFVLIYRTLIRQKKLTEQKDQFISNMTHELKTPIATVSVALEAMQNFNVLDDATRTREYLDISQKELQRLGLLVDKVLKLSMFENNMLEIHPEPLDFEALAAEVCAAMKLQFEKNNVVFSFERSGSDFQVTGDRLHLSGVLFNLLDNALKYGGEQPEIHVALFAGAEEVRAVITDNGNGIAPEYRDKVFEKFFRIQQGNRHDVKGYGLGLAYAAGIAKKHGGRITVESTPDKGSSFTLILPKKNG